MLKYWFLIASFLLVILSFSSVGITQNSPIVFSLNDSKTSAGAAEMEKARFLFLYKTVFVKYKSQFQKAAKRNRIPWKVLAAISYQESNWQEDAVSHTKVRGLMMLTEPTAAFLQVTDRQDPEQSISGGAKYFKIMMSKTPAFLSVKNKLALSLVGYNLGYGQVINLRHLAHLYGVSAYEWEDMKSLLPLVSDKFIGSNLRYGSAKGKEAVQYVENIFKYISWLNLKV